MNALRLEVTKREARYQRRLQDLMLQRSALDTEKAALDAEMRELEVCASTAVLCAPGLVSPCA